MSERKQKWTARPDSKISTQLPIIQDDVVKTTRNGVAQVYYDVIIAQAYYDVIMTWGVSYTGYFVFVKVNFLSTFYEPDRVKSQIIIFFVYNSEMLKHAESE